MTEKENCVSTITFHVRKECDENDNLDQTSLLLEPFQQFVENNRKQVRFADEEGHELCKVLEVRDYMQETDQHTSQRGNNKMSSFLAQSRLVLPRKRGMRLLYCLEGNSDVKEAVAKMMVCLESAACSSTFVFGVIAVKNVPYDKTVTVRYSFDKWKSLREIVAQFFLRDESGFMDRFFFVIDLKRRPYKAMPLEVAVKYTTSRTEYWDNNRGENYRFDVQSLAAEERRSTRTEMLF